MGLSAASGSCWSVGKSPERPSINQALPLSLPQSSSSSLVGNPGMRATMPFTASPVVSARFATRSLTAPPGLQKLAADEQHLSSYNQWTNEPVVVDLNGDGRDEMITWGRRLIVVGSRWHPEEPASR